MIPARSQRMEARKLSNRKPWKACKVPDIRPLAKLIIQATMIRHENT
jgi:hypothetical protein